MIITSDNSFNFSLRTVPEGRRTAMDIFGDMLSIKRANCPNWPDESLSDPGVQLLWMFSVLADWMRVHQLRIKRDSFISLTQDRAYMRELVSAINYQLAEASAAAVKVTFNCSAGHPEFTIPKGTQVRAEIEADNTSVIFETSAAQLVGVGVNAVEIDCVQGQTITEEVVGSSDGTTGQEFTLGRSPVIWQSETVEVYHGAWETWTRVDNFVDSTPSDLHYVVSIDENGVYSITFGDGQNGAIPIRGSGNIRSTYRIVGGQSGNVAAGSITELVTSVQYVDSVVNAAAASGGTDRETLDHARIYGPGSLKTSYGVVSLRDIELFASGYVSTDYGAVAIARANYVGGSSVHVMIVPASGGLPSAGLKNELKTAIDARRDACTNIAVIDPTYLLVNVTVSINTLDNYPPSEVADRVRNRIVQFLSPTYQDPSTALYKNEFGRNIYLSDLYRIIDDTEGVEFCNITLPATDTIVADYQIADIGILNITVNTPSDSVSYNDMSTAINTTRSAGSQA